MFEQSRRGTSIEWRRAAIWALALAAAMGVSACSSLRKDFVKEPSTAQPAKFDTPSGRYVEGELQRHSDQSGFRLLTRNTNALMSRIALIDHAAHTIDLQYYIFADDDTGRLVAQRLVVAADRGVRVRLLLDDMTLDDSKHVFDALDAHPNIEVRRFNPFRTSSPSLPSKVGQFIVEGQRLNRRMHNKSFIVDNVVAIVGGRNIGDAYFDASGELNFTDLDVVAIGSVVPQASKAFDAYWNSDAAYPVTAFKDAHTSAADLERLREQLRAHARAFAESDYAQAALEEFPNGPTADRRGAWFWGSGQLIADEPEKVEASKEATEKVEASQQVPAFRIGPKVRQIFDAAQRQVYIISPYLIPGDNGTEYLTGLAARGVDVAALTNSLASTDEPVAYAGYSHYRDRLLRGGVHLYELRPVPGTAQAATAYGTSGGIALHAKSVVVDDRYVFIGSMNMDQRSKLLNTEMGVIVDCQPLAEAVVDFFHKATRPESAYAVTLSDGSDGQRAGRLEWLSETRGVRTVAHSEPDATAGRKFEFELLQLLPIDNLL